MTTAPGEGDAGVNEQRLRDYLKRATADLRKANRRLREMELKEARPYRDYLHELPLPRECGLTGRFVAAAHQGNRRGIAVSG